jgi:hypothetical protein
MKQLIVQGIAVILLGLGGCGRQTQGGGEPQKAEFPEVMVGVWEANINYYSKWGIKFEADGSIKNIIHYVAGPIDVTEGGVDRETEDTYDIFVMGPCEANYIPETHTIKVKIIVDYLAISSPGDELEERIEDYFEGSVSEDGKTWIVDWREYSWFEDATPPAEASPAGRLIFSKLDPAQVMKEDNTQ